MDRWFRLHHGKFRVALGVASALWALVWWRHWNQISAVLGVIVFVLVTVVMVYLPRS